ncbi:hypothetical protein GCM10027291_03220 [Telluribacter humicola]
MGEVIRMFSLAQGRVERSHGDVDSDEKLLVHGLGGLGDKSRAEYTEILIPLISPMLKILNGNRSVTKE